MLLQRYYLECLSHASYLVADEQAKEAAVIDPQRDIDLYVQAAQERGLSIKHVILTHFHADFVAGHIELRDKLLKLPDETLVYPAHGAGSMCGRVLSDEAVSTLGQQKHDNYALQPMSREKFVAMVTVDQPATPDYFMHDAIMNRQDRVSLLAQQGRENVLDLVGGYQAWLATQSERPLAGSTSAE